jgi:hypothetical protein
MGSPLKKWQYKTPLINSVKPRPDSQTESEKNTTGLTGKQAKTPHARGIRR